MTYTHVRAKEALRVLQAAAAKMVVEFEKQLGLPFEAEKSVLLGSHRALTRAAEGALGRYAGKAARAVRRLGVDHRLGSQPTSLAVWRARWAKTAG